MCLALAQLNAPPDMASQWSRYSEAYREGPDAEQQVPALDLHASTASTNKDPSEAIVPSESVEKMGPSGIAVPGTLELVSKPPARSRAIKEAVVIVSATPEPTLGARKVAKEPPRENRSPKAKSSLSGGADHSTLLQIKIPWSSNVDGMRNGASSEEILDIIEKIRAVLQRDVQDFVERTRIIADMKIDSTNLDISNMVGLTHGKPTYSREEEFCTSQDIELPVLALVSTVVYRSMFSANWPNDGNIMLKHERRTERELGMVPLSANETWTNKG